MMIDWHIQSRSRACRECERAFEAKQRYYTFLYETREGFERTDVCIRCWEEQFQHGASEKKGFISHWQGVFLLPPPPEPEAIRRDTAEDLLYKLSEENRADRQPVLFILAVMLERKRQLKVRQQFVRDGQKVIIYEHPKKGDTFTVVDPDLKLDQLEEIQKEVAHLLENGLHTNPESASPLAEPDASIPDPGDFTGDFETPAEGIKEPEALTPHS